jgi:hypothetical protein
MLLFILNLNKNEKQAALFLYGFEMAGFPLLPVFIFEFFGFFFGFFLFFAFSGNFRMTKYIALKHFP